MIVESSPDRVRKQVREARRAGRHIGVVPTMGALHEGHVSLMEAACRDGMFTVATIFVNPAQFGPGEDFDRYPRTPDDDLARCMTAGADLVFTPETGAMYLPDAATTVTVSGLTDVLEGALRPGHFDGVTTIVAKLFHITEPDRAYFGQKDYQQQLIIRRMVRDLNFGLEVVTCPTVREPDGLAMSSRNRYLTPDERRRALILHRALLLAETLAADSTHSPASIERRMKDLMTAEPGVSVDYAVVADRETLQPLSVRPAAAVALIAARVGATRLIDNGILQFR
ncbi:MAG: pantoate--beta-alanine ligase [Planctomycetaceae bacterium]|nr:pantoate--beta-alanine ligase [Planctomycetaceae bacterium]